ncbi:MAG: hypothetical protein QM710_13195 [Flavobacterium sp.]
MKKFTFFVFALFAISVLSCQEEGESIEQDTTNNFAKTSPIASLISRVSQYETTADNVLDGTSNCSIKLPAHVTVNNTYVYVGSAADYQLVQNIKNQSSTDDDKVHFAFPVTVVYPSYYEHVLNTEAEFDAMMASYGDDSAYHKISCLNFNYPVSINVYNTNNQVASTVTIQTDAQLYSFIYHLTDSQVAGIVFPITLTNANAQQITINNNTQLEDAINSAVSSCNVGPSPSSLSDVLVSGSWHISYCFHGSDDTNQYNGYNFTFFVNGDVKAVKNSMIIYGDWDINDSGMMDRLDLNFDGDQLHDIETNWDVQEYTSTYVRLRKQNGGGGGPGPGPQSSYLSFTKN